MTVESAQEQIFALVDSVHDQLSRFARESYASDDRGAILVTFPALPPASIIIATTNMVYYTLAELRRLFVDLEGSSRADADILIRMVETYNPAAQAVVTVVIGLGNPVSIKMKLERPTLVDGPTTAQ